MVEPPMKVSKQDLLTINRSIDTVHEMGAKIRKSLQEYSDEHTHDTAWEVQAGVEAYVVRPPGELDPDDWLLKEGREVLNDNIKNPTDFMESVSYTHLTLPTKRTV